MNLKYLLTAFFLTAVLALTELALAQEQPNPGKAFLRSMAVPGWGHYYADKQNWTRGQIHLAADAVLIASYFGLRIRSSNLQKQTVTLARLKAGVDISERSRGFWLAVGNYSSIEQYNDVQLRSRNWNNIYDNNSENHWLWTNDADRQKYNDLRIGRDHVKNQLPALLGLMVVNRVVSAISAYNRVRSQHLHTTELTLHPVLNESGSTGAVAKVSLRF